MLFKPEYDENGKKILCEMNGINSEMLMDIYVKKMKKGEVLEICEDKNECAILLLSGDVTFKVKDEINERCKRKNPFEKKPYAIHFCKQVKASVTANEDSEVLVQMTDNEKTWKSEFYNPNNCLYQEFGKGQWNGTGHRIVSTMFDLDNAPESNMVMGEVFNQPGRGQAIRLIITRSLNFIIINSTIRRDSVQALRATHLTKQKTEVAFA